MAGFILKIIEFFIKIFYKVDLFWYKLKIFWHPFFFPKKRFLLAIIILVIVKVFYIFYILSILIQFFIIYYFVFYKKKSFEKIIDIYWSIPQPNTYKTYTSILFYLFIMLPKIKILKGFKIFKKFPLKFSKDIFIVFIKIFSWWVWVFFTSLPKNIFIFSRATLMFLSDVGWGKFNLNKEVSKIVDLVVKDFFENIVFLEIPITKTPIDDLILKFYPMSNKELNLVFKEVFEEAETKNCVIFLVKNYVPSFNYDYITFLAKKYQNLCFFYHVIEKDCCFSLICYKNNILEKNDNLKFELTKDLNNPIFVVSKNEILKFILKQDWNNMNFNQHLCYLTVIGMEIMDSFLESICCGVVVYLPKTWKYNK